MANNKNDISEKAKNSLFKDFTDKERETFLDYVRQGFRNGAKAVMNNYDTSSKESASSVWYNLKNKEKFKELLDLHLELQGLTPEANDMTLVEIIDDNKAYDRDRIQSIKELNDIMGRKESQSAKEFKIVIGDEEENVSS